MGMLLYYHESYANPNKPVRVKEVVAEPVVEVTPVAEAVVEPVVEAEVVTYTEVEDTDKKKPGRPKKEH